LCDQTRTRQRDRENVPVATSNNSKIPMTSRACILILLRKRCTRVEEKICKNSTELQKTRRTTNDERTLREASQESLELHTMTNTWHKLWKWVLECVKQSVSVFFFFFFFFLGQFFISRK
jgi:hypothetical protein